MSGYSVADLPARMQAKIAVGDTGCWLWTASKNKGGYGQVGVAAGKPALAHRVAYQTLVGPIPEGLELDHLCRVRNCCNPDHLEPVTRQENARRGLRNGFALQTHLFARASPDGGQPADRPHLLRYWPRLPGMRSRQRPHLPRAPKGHAARLTQQARALPSQPNASPPIKKENTVPPPPTPSKYLWCARAANVVPPADLPNLAMTVALLLDAALRISESPAREEAFRDVLDHLDSLTRHVRQVARTSQAESIGRAV